MVKYSLLYDNTQTIHLIQRNVVLLNRGNYTIKNYGYSSYEYITKADVGHNIVGGDHQQQWKIIDLEEHGTSYVCIYVCNFSISRTESDCQINSADNFFLMLHEQNTTLVTALVVLDKQLQFTESVRKLLNFATRCHVTG